MMAERSTGLPTPFRESVTGITTRMACHLSCRKARRAAPAAAANCRQVQHGDADGNEYSCRGVFHGTPSPDGIARTFEFEGRPGQVCLETIFFSERGDTTIVTQSSVYQSIQDRDWALRYDNAEDIYESIERLDDLIPRLVLLS